MSDVRAEPLSAKTQRSASGSFDGFEGGVEAMEAEVQMLQEVVNRSQTLKEEVSEAPHSFNEIPSA